MNIVTLVIMLGLIIVSGVEMWPALQVHKTENQETRWNDPVDQRVRWKFFIGAIVMLFSLIVIFTIGFFG